MALTFGPINIGIKAPSASKTSVVNAVSNKRFAVGYSAVLAIALGASQTSLLP